MKRLFSKFADNLYWMLATGFALGASGVFIGTMAHAQTGEAVRVTVTAASVPMDAKSVHICLWKGSKDFPLCAAGRGIHARATKSGGVWKANFRAVPAGTYAISGFADMDGNGKLDRNLIGMPREPIGLSVPEKPSGRPSFAKATVRISADTNYTLTFWKF